MRKMHQKQALEFVKLLEQANKEIKTSIERQDIAGAKGLLADCQDGAIQLGNLIEATEGEDFQGLSLIEAYCELVYQFHESLGGGEKADPGRIFKTLRQQLIKIENSIKNDVKIRKEVVFLPYKASMWDSLESVWKAADADPDCDAYVIPIPYYDKNPDGSFREMHYEGAQYPKDVPVVSYQDYDFEKRRPDVVFIHNPYDAENFVTSVHPDYYSGKLKEYTDKLVYIPYFVLNEIDPKDKAAVEEMKHFVLHAGVINADRVIVQSEKMRQIYIDVLSEAAGEQTRKVWEEKILGLGSPKFDKVVNAKVEERDIPKDWRKVIYRADGSRKKVILYNTSVSTLLKDTELYLAKLQRVLDTFWKYQEDVVLLWRPHPLMEATLRSMRPNLWEEYEKITEEYKNAGWGIYDGSGELSRAIELSDGYYGDGSSLVELCKKSGMPIMIQNVNV